MIGALLCQSMGCHGVSSLLPHASLTPDFPDPANSASAPAMPAGGMANPTVFSVSDPEFFWSQLVDTVDDYFNIQFEQPVQLMGGMMTEGRLVTEPQSGATAFEPWHWDSTPGFEKWHATFQSIRRRATVNVRPQANGVAVEVVVDKALEDVDAPSQGTPGSSTPRHDSSLLRLQGAKQQGARTLGWIAIGRDAPLEQEILQEFSARLSNPARAEGN